MNPGSPRFTVGLVGKAVEHLEQLTVQAERLNLQELLSAVFRHVIETLETRPREWGDPFHDYPGLNATGYKRAILPARLWIEYAVHNVDPVVWISKLIILEDSPFAGG
jgi:hypothetical protein